MIFAYSSASKVKVNDTQQPEWVINPSSKYSKSLYLSSVGDGVNRDSAENKAIEEIVSIFGHKITASTETQQRMEQAQQEGIVSLYKNEAINQQIVKSEEIDNVIGVEISEYWFDEKNERWYALSLINIENFTKIYTFMISQNDGEIRRLLKLENVENPSLEAYSFISLAEDVATENEENIRRLTIVNPEKGASLKKQCVSKTEIHESLLKMAYQIPIEVSVDSDFNSRLASEISKIVSSYGFRTTTGNAKYKLNGVFYTEEASTKDNKVLYCKYTFDLSLTDSEKNITIIPFTFSGREGSATYSDARSRAIKKIETNLEEKFKQDFENYIKSIK